MNPADFQPLDFHALTEEAAGFLLSHPENRVKAEDAIRAELTGMPLYDYCIRCGRCAAQCPVRAIDPSRGMDAAKAHPPCDAFLSHIRKQPPQGASRRMRYGCGKCQMGLPCTEGIPS